MKTCPVCRRPSRHFRTSMYAFPAEVCLNCYAREESLLDEEVVKRDRLSTLPVAYDGELDVLQQEVAAAPDADLVSWTAAVTRRERLLTEGHFVPLEAGLIARLKRLIRDEAAARRILGDRRRTA